MLSCSWFSDHLKCDSQRHNSLLHRSFLFLEYVCIVYNLHLYSFLWPEVKKRWTWILPPFAFYFNWGVSKVWNIVSNVLAVSCGGREHLQNIYIVRTHSIVSFLAFCLPRLWSLSFVAFSLSFLGAFFLLSLAGFHQFLPVNRTSPLLLLLIHSATSPEKVKLLLLLWCLLLEYFGIGEEAFWWLSTSSRTWHLNSIYCWHSDNFPPPWFPADNSYSIQHTRIEKHGSRRKKLLYLTYLQTLTYQSFGTELGSWRMKTNVIHLSANLPVFWLRFEMWDFSRDTNPFVRCANFKFFQRHKPICKVWNMKFSIVGIMLWSFPGTL